MKQPSPSRRSWLMRMAIVVILTSGMLSPVVAQDIGSDVQKALAWADSVLDEGIADGRVPGVVLLVALDGRIIHEQAYGAAKLFDYLGERLSQPEPLTIEHRFDLASVTKVMATTYGLMLLTDRGAVELDAPVYTYLPDFRGPEKDLITVRDLLTHRSGLYRWKPIYYHATTPAEAYVYIRDLPLEFAVHDGRHYSDLNFMLAGYIVERVSGRSLDVFLHEELYAPLGLTRTEFMRRGRSQEGPVAATSHGNPYERRMVADPDFGYRCDEDPDDFTGWRTYSLRGEVNDGNAWYAHGGVAGHAGLFSTARDLNTLLQVLLSGGMHGGRQVIHPGVIEAFLTPDRATGHGLGWVLSGTADSDPPPQFARFSHGGFTGTYVAGVPELDLAIVFLSNRQNTGVDETGRYPDVGSIYGPIVHRLVRAAAAAQRAGSQPPRTPPARR
jgi:serine-type D-Ala-D-Ala carboxypeptidase